MTGPRIGSLFSGYGGLEQGVQQVLGGTTAWHSEIDPGACKILAHRYPDVPNLGDITAVDWTQVEPVDVLTGGFPCQDVSCAGLRKGMRPDTRSGLWTQFAYAIDQLRPGLVVIENVRGLLSAGAHSDLEPCPWCVGDGGGVSLRALGAVLGDLANLGYDASWQGLRAADVGAPHGRFRVFVVAWPAQDADFAARGERRLAAPGQAEGRGARADARERGGAPAADAGELGWVGRTGVVGGGRHEAIGSETRGHPGDADRAPTAHSEGHGRDEGRPEPARLVGGSDDALGGDQTVCTTCHDPVDFHDADGFCAGACGGSCTDPWFGRPDAATHADRDGREGQPWAPERRDAVRLDQWGDVDRRDGDTAADTGGARLGEHPGAAPAEEARPGSGHELAGHRGPRPSVDWGPYAPAIHRWERALGRVAPPPTELSAKGSPRLSPAFVEFMMGLPAGWVTDVPGLTRNDQLKALGNGVVPQQAAHALRLLLPDVVERAS